MWVRIGLLYAILLLSAQAHDFWTAYEDGLVLHGGHYFPKTEGGPNPRVINHWAWRANNGPWLTWEKETGQPWTVAMDEPGTYQTILELKPPRAKEPNYYGHTFLIRGPAPDTWPDALGTGLEIVPRTTNDTTEWIVQKNGAPIRATLLIQQEGHSSKRIESSPDKPAQLSPTPGIPLLLSTSVGAQSVSLSIIWLP